MPVAVLERLELKAIVVSLVSDALYRSMYGVLVVPPPNTAYPAKDAPWKFVLIAERFSRVCFVKAES